MRGVVLLAGLAAFAACDVYDRDFGPAPFLCGPSEPRCPMGYTCMEDGISGDEICVRTGGSVSGSFDCADDSAYEPNEGLAAATMTTIDTTGTFTLDGLAVCPANDRDVFSIMVGAATTSVEVIVAFDPSAVALQGAILNQGGVTIAASAVETPGMMRVTRQTLPPGRYFVAVFGPNTSAPAVNNYKLTINAQ